MTTTDIKALLGFILVLATAAAAASDLKPFTTDGCSRFPEGTRSQQELWLDCCTRHDIAYWQGGGYGDRLAADRQLEQCVAGVGAPEIALIMLAGVRVGGTPYLPTKFRWGYGWPYLRGYKKLDDAEKKLVRETLDTLGNDH